ncbi:MAG: hypothetical protein JSS32_01505 [Verrucomicrobia bacterium]|nr:hypothetical protein [Verrucomicrobiota bacterium]
MALYALDSEGVVSADEAPDRGQYWCLECNSPVQVRQGQRRRHFYHVKTSPSCRLYSKSEDHLLLQLEIKNLFAKEEIHLERPFVSIGRLADACWERCKIVFEIQCSQLSASEARSRIHDYASVGYSVVWLLDDRLFNRRILRPGELQLRQHLCYYVKFRRTTRSFFYDQFEVFQGNRRLKRGSRLSVQLPAPRQMPRSLPDRLPQQILNRIHHSRLFFQGDLIHKALLSQRVRPLAIAMQNWRFIEDSTPQDPTPTLWQSWRKRVFIEPLCRLFEYFLDSIESDR